MEFVVGVLMIGLLWLLCMIGVPIGAVLLVGRPRAKKPAPAIKTIKIKAIKTPAPPPAYMRRWTFDRRWQAQQDLLRFEQLLKD